MLALLISVFSLCAVCGSDAFAGSVSALMTYEKGIDALKDGNCKISMMYFNKAIGLDPKDKTLRIGMYDFEYAPNGKLFDLQKTCQTPDADNMPAKNQTKQTTMEPLPLPVPPATAPDAGIQQGVEVKKKPPVVRDTHARGVFDENLRLSIDNQPLTITRDGDFSCVIALQPRKSNIVIQAKRVGEKKIPSVEFPLTFLGFSADTMTKDNLSSANLSVTGNVTYAGIERDEIQVTIDKSTLSLGGDIKIESNLPITVKLRF
ncbi:MAG: hypothetical protein HQL04_00305 [Nitrospirae bacterium]|nr:hypothetical protein [Nitrospirota bacterium]